MFDDKKMMPLQALITNAIANDKQIVDDIEINPGDTFVFDRAYNIYKWWYKIKISKVFFLTRMKKGRSFKILEHNKSLNQEGIIEDNIIQLTGSKKEEYP